MAGTPIQFGGDHDAFPLWRLDDRGQFDVNVPQLRRLLSGELAARLEDWAVRWAEVDGGDRDEEPGLTEALIAEARTLRALVAAELGPDHDVSFRWDDLRR